MTEISGYIATNPLLFYIISAILGLLIGSFLNVVIYRLPKMMESEWRLQCHEFLETAVQEPPKHPFNLVKPDSTCPKCGHAISALENIPVLSYLMLGGKCKSCKTPISKRYPMVEILSATLTVIIAYHFGYSYQALFAMFLTWALIALTFIDIDKQLLPDSITLPFLWIGLILNSNHLFTDIHSSLYGAVLGYMVLWIIYQLFKLATGKEGMGYGDFKLLALFGAWFGYQLLPLIILLSAGVGTVITLIMIALGKQQQQQTIPFGPYLAMAGWIAMLWGEIITNAYLHWANVI
jgi:leader peptidase (prepilin peptidase)/N-methyltransferase